MARASVADRLLRWYATNRRDLPWRRTRDPWAILVSEIMLQQTRVAAVRDAFARFVARYPDPRTLATIGDDELATAWRGLGYYRRARMLRAAAAAIASEHGGSVPADAEALGRLPGVGAYTRGAVGSIAFGLPLPAIDGNVERVVARHRSIHDDVGAAAGRRRIAATVADWLDRGRPGDFNQALMELGATVCTPTSPDCARCPIAADCGARRSGTTAELPARRPRRAPTIVAARCLVVPCADGVLAMRVPKGEPNAGQWDLPGPGVLQTVSAAELESATAGRCGARIEPGPVVATIAHAITHHRITVHAHAGSLRTRGRGRLEPLATFDPDVPWTTIARKVFARMRTGAAREQP